MRKLSRDEALVSLITLNELNYLVDLPLELQADGENQESIEYSQSVLNNSMSFWMEWIYQYSNPHLETQFTNLQSLWPVLKPIYQFSRDYASVWSILSGGFKRYIQISKTSYFSFSVEFRDSNELRIRASETSLSMLQYPHPSETDEGAELAKVITPNFVWSNIRHVDAHGGQKSLFSESAFQAMVDANKDYLLTQAQFNLDWDFGGFTVLELLQAWAVIKVHAYLQQEVWVSRIRQQRKTAFYDRLVLRKSKEEWQQDISKFGAIEQNHANLIIDHLTYSGLNNFKQRYLNHPFVQLTNGELALCNSSALISNCERNSLQILAEQHKGLHDSLTSLKESVWISQAPDIFSEWNFQLCAQVRYKNDTKIGDLDLLILAPEEKFGVVCELKWLILPGSISQEATARQTLKKGRRQAFDALAWINCKPAEAAQKFGISVEELQGYTLKPLVVSRGLLSAEYCPEYDVPVTTEDLMLISLRYFKTAPLRNTWQLFNERGFLLEENRHYRVESNIRKCGKITFDCQNTVAVPLREWKIETDIRTNDDRQSEDTTRRSNSALINP